MEEMKTLTINGVQYTVKDGNAVSFHEAQVRTGEERSRARANIGVKDPLIVTITDDVASHTSAEIYAHVQSGGRAVLKTAEMRWIYDMAGCCEDYAVFQHKTDDDFTHEHIIYSDGGYDRYEKQYVLAENCPTDGHINSLIDKKLGTTFDDIDTLLGGDS